MHMGSSVHGSRGVSSKPEAALKLDEKTREEEETPRRLEVQLFIVHPTLTPSEITAALGLEAKFSHQVGDQRKTLNGALRSGFYPDTRWRHTRLFTITDQWFAEYVNELVEYLEAHQNFLHDLRITGGKTTLIVVWLGAGYFGDVITKETLAKLVRLDVDLGIERYDVPQSA
jgi:hypothetical protein